MNPRDRIGDCHQIRHEIAREMPWFCSSDRLSQIASTYSAGKFGWFVHETRRVGNPPGHWAIICEKLYEWEYHSTH
jgi:hypothetical protein